MGTRRRSRENLAPDLRADKGGGVRGLFGVGGADKRTRVGPAHPILRKVLKLALQLLEIRDIDVRHGGFDRAGVVVAGDGEVVEVARQQRVRVKHPPPQLLGKDLSVQGHA